MSVLPARHPVTTAEFERMVEAGVFGADERLELIWGEIVDMSPIGSAHQACVNRLNALFAPLAVSGRSIVHVQGAVRIGDISQPQPDLALLRLRDDYYARGHPTPADVDLLVEVADSSLRFDRWTKMPAYARAGVAETWIVDLNGGVVDVATEPSSQGYGRLVQIAPGERLAPAAFPDLAVAVEQILG